MDVSIAEDIGRRLVNLPSSPDLVLRMSEPEIFIVSGRRDADHGASNYADLIGFFLLSSSGGHEFVHE